MASDHTNIHHNLTHHHSTTAMATIRRKIHLQRRKLPHVRLGGKKPQRGLFLVRTFRRIRLRYWLKLNYSCMLKKLKKYYQDMIKDLIESGASLESSYQQRRLREASLAVAGSHHGRILL